MRAIWQSFVSFFTSLKLTVWLLVLSMVLVFLATLDQRELGVLGIQQKWFHTFIVIHLVKGFPVPVFLGGYTIGSLLFLNLVAAFVYRFKFTWKKCGIWITHAGLLLLLVGGFLSGVMQEDYQMRMREGETKNYSESFNRHEVAVVDTAPADHDNVVAIPDDMLARAGAGKPLDLRADGAALPFLVTVRAYYRNAVLIRPGSDPRFASLPTATDGIGLRALAVPVAPTWHQNESNWPAAYIEISDPQSASPTLPPRTWLLSSQLGAPQTFEYAGRNWRIELRPVRRYTDFSLTLLKVTHDVYPGTDIPKNYASRVLLRAPGDPAGREVLIHMNAPLRHGGLAFYQYQMRAEAGESVLQVVRNPSWRIPYIACALMTIGLLVQFGMSLFLHSKRNRAGRIPAPPGGAAGATGAGGFRKIMKRLSIILPAAILLAAVAALAAAFRPQKNTTALDTEGFARLPVRADGRIKPLDTVARTSLLRFQGRQNVKSADGRALTPAEWLLDVTFRPEAAGRHRVFQIVHPELLALVRLDAADGDGGKRFSLAQLEPSLALIEENAKQADARDASQRDAFDRAVLELAGNLDAYRRLEYSLAPPAGSSSLNDARLMAEYGSLLAIPPGAAGGEWRKNGAVLLETNAGGAPDPAAVVYLGLALTWRSQDAAQFNEIVRLYHERLARQLPADVRKARIETIFNHAQPFYFSSVLFVAVFLLAAVSWLRWPDVLRRAALWLMALAWLLTTAGIVTRIWLGGYAPITNLYSSALGVAWFAVALCLVFEIVFRNAIASMAGGIIGFCALIIAHHLSLSGDTLEMMRAVLDNNFWLATHVVTITFGYAATFIAGIIAAIYIVMRLVPGALTKETADSFARMVYGVVCFAALFSLVGTVLGGIWADQSWGRFWGWDPKENGALIIVIWNAVLLHARWGGLVGQRGFMAMAVFGNIVTAWSWFGTNLLEVGLHSYGFTDNGALALGIFVLSQLAVIGLAQLPQRGAAAIEVKQARR